jgi:hypothetical protein
MKAPNGGSSLFSPEGMKNGVFYSWDVSFYIVIVGFITNLSAVFLFLIDAFVVIFMRFVFHKNIDINHSFDRQTQHQIYATILKDIQPQQIF